ncbi:MAG: polyribonucleotide nucleotidyltransferase [Phycisphaerae bacterium]|nr:polyribonucleotide nucleotidyltransferase [Phycisphaerae bacterium]NIP52093.1 polyribonucleotide nucleotidyltransferase [Phycisphaerae bacterium]NIS50058.1 polyribonucleotide nucleotidyltransferase [Phycisphaerae bacterium]NIU10313.1 polyribonucleotide nucleotidyltransferase [Phycisphaerae bacterium]NIU55324.1 polyribonucleotide nucleotidyltransferase [Phycisphaerae bacterium]
MFDVCRVERQIGGRNLSIETGKIAKQADGAVIVQYGETVVLVAAVTAPPRSEDIDFFPLSVDYREKQSAAGKFPGGFIKREGRPSTKETLTARQIDRPIRPLFPEGYVQEVQVMASVLSFDGENDPDVLAMIGASAALTISKIPFLGPIGACRLGRVNGEFVVNPTHKQITSGDLNLLLGGRKEAMNMIEVGAKELPEEVIAEAIATAQKTVAEVCEMIEELRGKVGVEKEIPLQETDEQLAAEISSKISDKIYELKQIPVKQERNTAVAELIDKILTEYCEGEDGDEAQYDRGMVKRIIGKIEGSVIKKLLLEGKRLDGRGYEDVRPIDCEVSILPRTHGSALFTRGETQSIASVTLGTIRDAQIIDGLLEEYTQSFTLHYNFPPFSVGEIRPIRGPGRREIGHGALAERALEQIRPPEDEFAYTVRIISDITESNGSSSMASVCGGSLALMDAGVPVKKAVAGISIGLISDEGGRYELLTDIMGEEDHYGEMDFKVAGTVDGITAIQLDIKAEGLAHNVMVEALARARTARLKILEVMNAAISKPRPELSKYAPKLISIEIDPEFIGKVIGPGGKMIKSIQEQTETTIEIEEDGTIYISCVGGDGYLEAKEIIETMTSPPKVGQIYQKSKVVSVKDFGVFVEITPGVEGLCHISELSDGYVKNVEEVCKMGDLIPVKLLAIDDQGRLRLSRKAALAEKGGKDQKPSGKDHKPSGKDRKPEEKE